MKRKSWLFVLFRATDTIRDKLQNVTPNNMIVRNSVLLIWIIIGVLITLAAITSDYRFVYVAAGCLIAFFVIDYLTDLQEASCSVRKFLLHFVFSNALAAGMIVVFLQPFAHMSDSIFFLIIYLIYFLLSVFMSLMAEEAVSKMGHVIIGSLITIITGGVSFVNNLLNVALFSYPEFVKIVTAAKTFFDIAWFPLVLIDAVCMLFASMKEYWRKKYGTDDNDETQT